MIPMFHSRLHNRGQNMEGNMPIIFTREDAQVCSRCNQNKPSFRLIALAVIDPTESSSLKTMAILVCTACLKLELDEFHQSLGQTKEPIEEWETKEMFFLPTNWHIGCSIGTGS